MSHLKQYNGVVFNQNQKPSAVDDFVALTDGAWRYQEVFLPANYVRGSDSSEEVIPALSGWQLCVTVDAGTSYAATLDWVFQYQQFGGGWATLATGTTRQAHAEGEKVWFDMLFEEPVDISEAIRISRLRFGVRGRSATSGAVRQAVTRDGQYVIVDGQQFAVTLIPGEPYPLTVSGIPGFLLCDSSDSIVYWTVERGVSAAWYAAPNPLALTFAAARQANGTTAIQDSGQDVSFLFRVLGQVADEGIDFLGNVYRSAVLTASANNVSAVDADADAIFMSAPQPSRFAVVNQYFDVRPVKALTYTGTTPDVQEIADDVAVIDNVLVDPVTPGVYFNVYYSTEGDLPATEDQWENKLWTRVPQSFRANKRENHALAHPILAKYIKIEYTHLQAKHYSPGDFAKPTKYKKHPKWVLDYFLARTITQRLNDDRLLTGRVGVVYDAIDLAYNYYLDDLAQEPDQPVEVDASFQATVTTFLTQRDDLSDQIDPIMLDKINLVLKPYQELPSVFAKPDYLLGQQSLVEQSQGLSDYPIERSAIPLEADDINTLRNNEVIFEADYPVMFFYLTCRHKYREVIAPFLHDRAYFVGLREVAFTRERYSVASDTAQYIEPAGDLLNIERNDFATDNGVLIV